MQQEIRFATFNVCNLAPPGMTFYDNLPAYTPQEYAEKTCWIAQQLDLIDADVIGFQEIFSQAALRDVLAKTEKYRHANHVGIDPDPDGTPLTPSVALVSRLPLAGSSLHRDLPDEVIGKLAWQDPAPRRFTRPVLQARVLIADGRMIDVFVVHLKSKRPDYHAGEDQNDPLLFGLASLRSLQRRGAEALGLYHLLHGAMQADDTPLVVLGDFNDTVDAVTTQLVMGVGRFGDNPFDHRLFDCRRIQTQRDLARHAGYTHLHDGAFNTIDHILVSRHFHPEYPGAEGAVIEVRYLNDHVLWQSPQASDHGVALARIGLYDRLAPASSR